VTVFLQCLDFGLGANALNRSVVPPELTLPRVQLVQSNLENLGQLQQLEGVSCWCSVEDDDVIRARLHIFYDIRQRGRLIYTRHP